MKNPHNIVRLVAAVVAAGTLIAAAVTFLNNTSHVEKILTPFLILVLVGLIGILVYVLATDQSRKICDKCGKSMNGCAYEYEETRRSNPDRRGYVTSTVKIIAECPYCEKKKKFSKKFKLHGSRTVGDMQDKVDKWCADKFGH